MPHFVRTILVTGPEDEVALARAEHVRHVASLRAQGKIRAAGAFTRGDGFLEIYDAKDLYEAEAIARSSPLVEQGLGTWMLREWEEL
ncbi:MAG TPA: YciI family protein [Candidatus Polarisedimenticolaceae bacterium]|nr:YciI family protein [Candidatus Polarisedimenticolaceae bacterium]